MKRTPAKASPLSVTDILLVGRETANLSLQQPFEYTVASFYTVWLININPGLRGECGSTAASNLVIDCFRFKRLSCYDGDLCLFQYIFFGVVSCREILDARVRIRCGQRKTADSLRAKVKAMSKRQTQQQQQLSQQPQQTQQQVGRSVSQSLPPQAAQVVTDLDKIETIAEFTKTQAAQQGIPIVPQVADDIKNISELQKDLIVRQSPVAQALSQCVEQALQQSIQQLQQFQQQPEVQELVQEVQQTTPQLRQATQQLPQGGQQMAQQPGQQF
jgi:hypothetical protein